MGQEERPHDTSRISLPRELSELRERLARNTHAHWSALRVAEGWSFGPFRDDVRKQHPGLVPYEDLPESEKEYDRTTAMETLRTIVALGYRIEPPARTPPSDVLATVDAVDDALGELAVASADDLLDRLARCRGPARERLWREDPRLYHAFVQRLIASGRPGRALRLAREGLRHHEGDLELLYLEALALARGGNLSKAAERIETVSGLVRSRRGVAASLKVDILSLAGRIEKDRFERATAPSEKVRRALDSARLYESVHRMTASAFPTINAATMFCLAHRPREARRLAQVAANKAYAERARVSGYWISATLGEAHVLLEEHEKALGYYRDAVERAKGRLGDLASMRRQLELIGQRLPVAKEILGLFEGGTVAAFSGYRDRGAWSPTLERAARAAIGERIDGVRVRVGFTGLASRLDILFAEGMMARGVELHVVLPFPGYVARVVEEVGRSALGWRRRFDVILGPARAEGRLHHATADPSAEDDVLRDFVTTVVQGLAIARARSLGFETRAIAVLEADGRASAGDSTGFLAKWRGLGHAAMTIDLARRRTGRRVAVASRSRRPRAATGAGREVMAILFADFDGRRRLEEAQVSLLHAELLGEVARALREMKGRPASCNTWGEGLFVVFSSVVHCADLALRLLERVARMDGAVLGLPPDIGVRVGLHAGPVSLGVDPVSGRRSVFGGNVGRAATIEPVGVPGCAYASEPFMALLAATRGHRFGGEYVGTETLADADDPCPLYRIVRR